MKSLLGEEKKSDFNYYSNFIFGLKCTMYVQ